jgi:hypothetical protein
VSASDNRITQDFQYIDRIIPTQACISNALTINELSRIVLACREFLSTRFQVAFQHHAKDVLRSTGQLLSDIVCDIDLTLVLFVAVGVRAVDLQTRIDIRGLQFIEYDFHACGIVVWLLSTAQYNMTIFVASSTYDRNVPVFVYPKEVMWICSRLNGVGCDSNVAIVAVLESNGCRSTRCKLSMHLVFGCACADSAPAD